MVRTSGFGPFLVRASQPSIMEVVAARAPTRKVLEGGAVKTNGQRDSNATT
jgi:hypothetical protein